MSGFGGFGCPQERKKRAAGRLQKWKVDWKMDFHLPPTLFLPRDHTSLYLRNSGNSREYMHAWQKSCLHMVMVTRRLRVLTPRHPLPPPHFSPEKLQSCCNQILLVFPTILLLLGWKRWKLRSNTNTSLALYHLTLLCVHAEGQGVVSMYYGSHKNEMIAASLP